MKTRAQHIDAAADMDVVWARGFAIAGAVAAGLFILYPLASVWGWI